MSNKEAVSRDRSYTNLLPKNFARETIEFAAPGIYPPHRAMQSLSMSGPIAKLLTQLLQSRRMRFRDSLHRSGAAVACSSQPSFLKYLSVSIKCLVDRSAICKRTCSHSLACSWLPMKEEDKTLPLAPNDIFERHFGADLLHAD